MTKGALSSSDGRVVDPDGGLDEGFHLDLERYWIEARTLRFWIAGIVIAAILLGLIITLLSTSLFRAGARLEISQVTADITAANPLSSEAQVSDLQYLNTQYELLESRFMAERVSKAGNLLRSEEFIAAFALEGEDELTDRDIEKTLLDNIAIEPLTQSSLVDVSFSSPSPTLSATIANLWADEFIAANYEKRFGANVDARDFLNAQIAELRVRLASSEKELVDYANANEILVIESRSGEDSGDAASQTLIASDLSALNTALAKAVTDRIAAEAALASGDVPSQDPKSTLKVDLAKAEAELASLKSTFGPDFPPLVEKRVEVESLKASLTSEARAALRAALTREREFKRKLEQAKTSFLGQQNLGIQYGILKREVETNRELYNGLLQRVKELGASGAGENNIKLIDKAAVPLQPYAPSLIQNLLVGLVVGLILAGALIYLRVVLSQTVKDPQDLSRKLGLSILGMIPKTNVEDIREEILSRSSELNEAYKSARTNLTFLTPEGSPKTLMLTSSVPSEGKSISSLALATSFAQLGKRTLLIDADLRNSRMQQLFKLDLSKKGGLAALLTNNATSFKEQICQIEEFGFDYLPHGHTPPNPVELLAGPNFRQLLDDVDGQYDQILIDSAPMLNLADAVELSRLADGVVYIVEAERMKIRLIETAINRLSSSGAQVYGVIVTKLKANSAAYGYGQGYGYGYGYGYGNKADELS